MPSSNPWSRAGEARLHLLAPPGSARAAGLFRTAALLVLALGLLQPACLFRKKKVLEASKYAAAAIRCVPLPLNIPPDHPEMRWVALGATAAMARLLRDAPDLEAVPLWESIPIAQGLVGETRAISPESAAYLASRLGARWAIQGELLPVRRGMRLRIDFIPARASQVAYRYEGTFAPDRLEQRMREAFRQFLEYLIVRPLPRRMAAGPSADLQAIAQALEQEYGWHGAASPGKAEPIVARLAASEIEVARILFSPTLYPALRPPPGETPAKAVKTPAGVN